LVALCAVIPAPSFAQDAPKKELSERTGEQMGKLRELTDAQSFDQALTLINSLIAGAKPESYDLVVLNQVKVQILISQSKYAETIAPMELVLRLGKQYNFIEQRQYLEFTQILSQLYFQEANATK